MSKKGLFSFFKSNPEDTATPTAESSAKRPSVGPTEKMVSSAKEHLEAILKKSDFEGKVSAKIEEDEFISLEIEETDDTGRIIGREGNTIESYQVLLKAMMYKQFNAPVKVVVDAGQYKRKRLDKAQNMALRAAQSIDLSVTKQELDPMNAAERRAVHMLFQDHAELISYSVGEGVTRRVVIERREKSPA